MRLRRIATMGDGIPLAIVSVVAAALVLMPFRELLPAATVMLLFVPVIIGVSRVSGPWGSTIAAGLAFIALDLFFVPPYYRLTVASVPEWLGLLVFLIVALVTGQQTAAIRGRERAAIRRRDELALLNQLSFRIASEKSVDAIAQFIVGQVAEVLGVARAALYVAASPTTTPRCLAQAGLARPSTGEAALVSWVMRTSKAVGMPAMQDVPFDQRVASVGASEAVPGVTAAGVYIPLQTSTSLEGALFVESDATQPLTSDDARLLAAVANLAATSLERQRLEEDAAHAEALREADRLKSTLVSSVSHELKTPLAAATARVTGLLEDDVERNPERTHEELTAIAEDLTRLNDSIGALLDLSRLESDAWQPHFEPYDVADILGTVLSRLPRGQRERVRFDLGNRLPEVRADYAQLARALSNLVENALLYAPADSIVEVGARAQRTQMQISVTDHGPGVPDDEKAHVFDKFFRGAAASSAPAGTGLGLAIAREIVRTHEGTLRVEDAEPHGARFVLTVPLATKESA